MLKEEDDEEKLEQEKIKYKCELEEIVEQFKKQLQSLSSKINDISDDIENAIEKIKSRCSHLKHQLCLKTESIIIEINQISEEMHAKVNQYEADCINSFEKNIASRDKAKKELNEKRQFVESSKTHLVKHRPNKFTMEKRLNTSKQLLDELEETQMNIRAIIFEKSYLAFNENEQKIDQSIMGFFKKEHIRLECDSTILDDNRLRKDLVNLSKCLLETDWKLIYRGTRDGMSCESFHEKCDNIKNTLTLIKANNGHILGGYTDQEWDSFSGYKSDPNAYIFSLRNLNDCPFLFKAANNGRYAIECRKELGPCFGMSDISIKFNQNNHYYFGLSYENENVKNRINMNFNAADSFLFDILEIELFTKCE
jgi:hypothetical protein